jgi:glucose-fructose oxidoreductase
MEAVEIVQSGQLGEVRTFNSLLTQQVQLGNVRLLPIDQGGGPLYDLGIYCINAARYLFQDEPIEVLAVSANCKEQRFSEVEEMTSAILRFPEERLATFTCSFGAATILSYQIVGTLGDLRLDPAYGFEGELKHQLTIKGQTQSRTFAPRDQFAAQLLYFSDCVMRGEEPEPSGAEGLNDIRIIRSLYQSREMGHPVKVNHLEQRRRPTIKQVRNCPVPPKPQLINAKDPSGNS